MEEAQLKEAKYTVVYKDGEEIARMDGHVAVKPKDYDDKLPIEVHHVVLDTVGIFRIER